MTAAEATTIPTPQPLLRLLHWAMLWSPLRDEALGADSWQALGLPGHYRDHASAFNKLFVLDYPLPQVSLLLSFTLQREAGACREEWMRIAEYLGLTREGPSLPPDHLALACEVLAHCALHHERVLCTGITTRYLQPWLGKATAACSDPALSRMLVCFEQDVMAIANG